MSRIGQRSGDCTSDDGRDVKLPGFERPTGGSERLGDDLLARNASAGSPINLRRAEHRREHLDEIEQALARSGPRFLVAVALGLVTALGPAVPVAAQPAVTITNNLPASTVCPGGNTVSVFALQQPQQVIQPGGKPIRVTGDFSNPPGLGIQVNNWYWTSIRLPVQSGNPQTGTPQNPDNSGAQFSISGQCALGQQPAWFGKGIATYLIATVTATRTGDGCSIAIAPGAYTNAVTPGCCSPPGIGGKTCTAAWGVTNSGQPWPPR